MHKLHITDKGLLIPSNCLTGLPSDMVVRRINDRLIIETESQARVSENLFDMVQNLRKAGDDLGVPDENEIYELVDEVRTKNAPHN